MRGSVHLERVERIRVASGAGAGAIRCRFGMPRLTDEPLSTPCPRTMERRSANDIIGLMPAAGLASRLAPLPCSKEVLPLSYEVDATRSGPRVVCHHLLERYRSAGASRVYIVIRNGKWDIPGFLGDGSALGLHLAYLMMGHPFGTPYSLDQAYPFVRDARVLLGFPDILFEPDDAFDALLHKQDSTGADLVLGAFPTDRPSKFDLLELDGNGKPVRLVIKPTSTDLRYAWILAAWGPTFTEFMHAYLERVLPEYESRASRELFLGHVVQAAMAEGLAVEAVAFPEGRCTDLGTPDDFARALGGRAYG